MKKLDHPIQVTQAVLPDEQKYFDGLREIFASHWLTNHGPNVSELEKQLKDKLGLDNLVLTNNGTTALLLASRQAGFKGREVITTPFSYVGTLSSLLWEDSVPIFCDIDEENLGLDPKLLDSLPCTDPAGIMPVHIYGNACDIDGIDAFAASHGLKTIYDAAQAFGSTYRGKSILSCGDFSICSFHSTKLFHTVEGGSITTRDPEDSASLRLMSAFGHVGDKHMSLGINAKMTELHALMGLCLLDGVADSIAGRKAVSEHYDSLLISSGLRKPAINPDCGYNYAYYPIIFQDEPTLLKAVKKLNELNVFPRRYFYPSLNTLPYLGEDERTACPVSERIARQVLCLPLYPGLEDEVVELIAAAVKSVL